MSVDQFEVVRPLIVSGMAYAEISVARHFVVLGCGGQGSEFKTFTVAEARELRDWLNAALPQSDGG